jgi:hypothetical protein
MVLSSFDGVFGWSLQVGGRLEQSSRQAKAWRSQSITSFGRIVLLGEDIMIVDGADTVLRTRNPVGGWSATVGRQRIRRARISSIDQFCLRVEGCSR